MKRKSRGERVNKGRCCAMFGWTRYKFDQNIAKGMPYVRAAAHKGEEWVVNTAEVEAWLEAGTGSAVAGGGSRRTSTLTSALSSRASTAAGSATSAGSQTITPGRPRRPGTE